MKQSTNTQAAYVCVCARVTEEDFRKIVRETEVCTYAALKAAYGIGGQCTSCEYEIKDLLDECLTDKIRAEKQARKVRLAAKDPVERGHRLARFFRRFRKPEPVEPAPAPVAAAPVPPIPESYRTGMFFLRKHGLESHLVLANLQFPEHAANPNGAVTFHVDLHGEDGGHLATSRKFTLPNNSSLECPARDLFPEVRGDVVGSMYPVLENVVQTGSLRPYGVLVNTTPEAGRARCHYHDKFALFTDPGHFQNNSPFEPGQECWMAISNCQPKRYESDYHLRYGGTVLDGRLELEPMASRWVRLADLFPGLDPAAPELPGALFWLENPQHVMMYFLWRAGNVWLCQHH